VAGSEVAIAGAHGQIGRRLTRLLVARGDRVRGLIRNPDHADDVRADGGEPVICDLESASVEEIASAVAGADAAVFAAGAGPGSGAERKWTMDRDGAVKLLEASPPRYVIVSSIGTDNPPDGDDVFSVYLRAKAEADAAVAASDLDWTIVRPGSLTDDRGEGRVTLSVDPVRDRIARDDVAAVLAAVLAEPRTVGKILYLVRGDDPIDVALESVLR
jgi:uncharacterized protein YbjT (DUF2867 family)